MVAIDLSDVSDDTKIILFPSWVEHSVLPNMTESARISVSFNLSV